MAILRVHNLRSTKLSVGWLSFQPFQSREWDISADEIDKLGEKLSLAKSVGAIDFYTSTNPDVPGAVESALTGGSRAYVLTTRNFFMEVLDNLGRGWSPAEISDGLPATIYQGADSLPAVPDNPTAPNFAMVYDRGPPDSLNLAYWNYPLGAAGSWVVTQAPYAYPFLTAGPIVNQVPSNGAGNSPWAYSMGMAVRVKAAGQIVNMSAKLGQTAIRQWEIRKSTVISATPPAANTYTIIERSNQVNITLANTWQNVGIGAPIIVAPDEWYIGWIYVGIGGQSAAVATLRTNNQLLEDFAELVSGAYTFTGGAVPGPAVLPTPTTLPTIIYGVTSLEFASL